MKIALVSPRGAERFYAGSMFDDLEKLLHRELIFLMEDMEWMPNLGLLTLAGVIPPHHQLTYIDEEYLPADTLAHLLYREEFDMVCLSVINAQSRRAYQIADIFRGRGIPVAMGGIHPTALPDECRGHCDYLFIGEAEESFPRFLLDFDRGDPLPVYEGREQVDLSRLPPPRFDLLTQFDYHKKYNRFPIQGTRGCPRQCDFCFLPVMYGPGHRHKSVDQVIREVSMIKEIVGDPFISFTDENMLLNLDYAMELSRRMGEMGVLWECYCDISVAEQDELLECLRESNCVLLLIGLESLRRENLVRENPWKASRVDGYRQSVEKIQSKGMGVSGLFIVGFEHDTPDVFDEICDFARRTRLMDVEVSALCPFPGTELYRRMEQQGRIFCRDWSRYTWIHVNHQPMKMSAGEILEGLFGLFVKLTSLDRLIMQKKYFKKTARKLYDRSADTTGRPTFLTGR